MNNDFEKQREVSEILKRLANNLDIPPSKQKEVDEKYKAVSKWLSEEGSELSEFDPDIYSHGSFRLGTVVAPVGRDEFDLDFVCQLSLRRNCDPSSLKKLVGNRLRSNGRYAPILIEKNRCWRLNYSGDFHMDIMPAIPDYSLGTNHIFVSDKELQQWKESNPKGFANWFNEVMVPIRKSIRVENRASVEELPDSAIKTPLQRSIQFLKRYRDLKFGYRTKLKPSSIILTTLAAKAYNQQDNLYAALLSIATRMEDQIEYDGENPVVLNPANPNENLAEKWISHPERFEAFRDWLKELRTDLRLYINEDDLPTLSEHLRPNFGESVVNRAIAEYSKNLGDLKTLGSLGVGSGPYVVSKKSNDPIRSNSFYGS